MAQVRLNGWQRLWVLVKVLASIYVGLWGANEFWQNMPETVNGVQPTPGQRVFGATFVVAVFGGVTFAILHALEWVYRGFRPLPTVPKAEPPAPSEPVPEPTPKPLPALPQPANKQSTSSPPAWHEPQREFLP